MKTYLFTSESVSEGHPDKVADQISDAILDEFLRQDSESKVACETFCSTGMVVVAGEVSSEAYIDIQGTARKIIEKIGYNNADYMFEAKSCGILSAIHEQSADIHRGVVRENADQGAGDQGIMFGYACNETDSYMPLPLYLSHRVLEILSEIRRSPEKLMPYLRPDAKSQFTVEYDADSHKPVRIHTIVISTQHDDFGSDEAMHARIEQDVREILLPSLIATLPAETAALFKGDYILHVNPTGKFVIGGPAGDTGLTGRKIIVDTYGGRGAHGGGAFSGKDPSKVDRSAAYAARHIAKNIVAAGAAEEVLVQLSYAIGIAKPLSIFVDTYGTAACDKNGNKISDEQIADLINSHFDLRPASIIKRFGLKNPIYLSTAAYGHMGRKPYKAPVELFREGKKTTEEVQFFGWEILDEVENIKAGLNL